MSIDNCSTLLSSFSSGFVLFYASCLKMISGKLFWLILVQLTIFKGCNSLNTTQERIENVSPQNRTLGVASPSIIPPTTPITTSTISTKTQTLNQNETLIRSASINSTNLDKIQLELKEIFHGGSNITIVPTEKSVTTTITNRCLNATFTDESWNETFKTNYTTMAEAVGVSEGFPALRLQNTAAIAAGVFLISAVVGYFSCVAYRRFLQRKYGNSQILIGEEVYDTTDLRYFEI